jgi:hypothetical protein
LEERGGEEGGEGAFHGDVLHVACSVIGYWKR